MGRNRSTQLKGCLIYEKNTPWAPTNLKSKISKPQSLRVLIVEDSEDDVLLIIRELKKGGYNPLYERVETSTAMKKALKEKPWDIILCDYTLPKFSVAKAIAGLLETEYAGLDAELAVPLFKGRILAGLSGSLVKKRDTANPFALNNSDLGDHYHNHTEFFNARLNLPEIEMAVDVKAGEFLAGDKGARITISNNFNGVILSAW
jgi:hypothetical protein